MKTPAQQAEEVREALLAITRGHTVQQAAFDVFNAALAALVQRLEEAERALNADPNAEWVRELRRSRDEALAKLATAREEALEEAAAWYERATGEMDSDWISEGIRALKKGTTP